MNQQLDKSTAEGWFRQILDQLDPRVLTRGAISIDADGLCVADGTLSLTGKLVVVAVGKAAIAMAAGVQDALGDTFEKGMVLTVEGPDASGLDQRWTVYRGGHPLPTREGIEASRAIIDFVETLHENDIVLALISGGGSALFEAPCAPITLDDIATLTRLLLDAGAPIQDLNTVRIPLSEVKGGSFRYRSPAGRFVTLILSDVLGNDPQIIASGPTVAPASTSADALRVLDHYQLRDRVPDSIREVLGWEPVDNGDRDFSDDRLTIVGDNQYALDLAVATSTANGWKTNVLWTGTEGEAAELGRMWTDSLATLPDDVEVVWGGGEATVRVVGHGSGGRNTEFALAAAMQLEQRHDDRWIIASFATDGQDAMTGSAGAIADLETMERARSLELDPARYLANNDSATFFEQTGGLIITGPSGTNVNDLYLGLRKRSR